MVLSYLYAVMVNSIYRVISLYNLLCKFEKLVIVAVIIYTVLSCAAF
jgi:hypothetical protein